MSSSTRSNYMDMVTFIAGVALVLTALSGIVFLLLIGLIVSETVRSLYRLLRKEKALPPPDRAAERTYGQKYFERAVSKD